MHTIVYVEIFIYLLAMLGVGIYFSKKIYHIMITF